MEQTRNAPDGYFCAVIQELWTSKVRNLRGEERIRYSPRAKSPLPTWEVVAEGWAPILRAVSWPSYYQQQKYNIENINFWKLLGSIQVWDDRTKVNERFPI